MAADRPHRRARRIPKIAQVWLATASLLFAACATSSVEERIVSPRTFAAQETVTAFAFEEISERTKVLLERLALPTDDFVASAAGLAAPQQGIEDRERLLAQAEVLFALGAKEDGLAAAQHFADAGCAATRALAAGTAAPAEHGATSIDLTAHRALAAATRATVHFLSTCIDATSNPRELTELLRSQFEVEVVFDVDGPWQLDDFDNWICADTLVFEGIRHRHRRPGAGAALVLERSPQLGIHVPLTPEAVCRPATAVIQPSAQPGAPTQLRLLNPRTRTSVELLPGVRAPLAADFTAPFAHLTSKANLQSFEDRSFFSASVDGHEGIYLLEDYDPDRQPLIMVHGLWSSPLTWRDLTNDILGDETLHNRYQVWHFMYATGAPLLENARLLRQTIDIVRQRLDPELDDLASRMGPVLIGHSMGGLLSRIVLTASGDKMWQTLFEGALDDVRDKLSEDELALAEGLFFWEPLSYVPRAIFIAAPHRGSGMADGMIGWLGSSMVTVPQRLRSLVDHLRQHATVRVEVPNSVDELSEQHPVLRTLATFPLRAGLIYHSIMGNLSDNEDPNTWSDGIVPYRSSHLSGAASELIVPGADHSVHFDLRASAEVRRILREAPALPIGR
ncbi:MAG: esterase/lipase family protein [Planctomycetota bacterium]